MEKQVYQTPNQEVVKVIYDNVICGTGVGGSGSGNDMPGGDD